MDFTDANEVRELDRSLICAILFSQIKFFLVLRFQSVPMFVEIGWIEQELGMLYAKRATMLRNPAFAKDQTLLPIGQGVADCCPFLESNGKR